VLAAVLSVVLLSAVGVILAAAMGAGGMALDSIFVLFVAAAMAANLLVWPMIFQKYENKNTRAQVLGAQCAQARHAHSDPAAGKTDPIPEHWVPLEDVRNLPEAEPITGLEHLLENFPFAPLRGDLFERPQHMRHGLQ
jgi:hypothetical protein